MTPKGYVINLAASPERMAHSKAQLEAHGIDPVRVDGMDGRQINPNAYDIYDDAHAQRYMGRSMTGGEIGCYESHRRALSAFVESQEPMAIVFEDDITFEPNAKDILHQLLDWLASTDLDWHAVNIGARRPKITTPVAQIGTHQLVRAHYFPMLAHAMIWSRAGAEAYLDAAKDLFCPADNMMRYVLTRSNKGFATIPKLVDAAHFDSDIAARSEGNRATHQRSTAYFFRKQRRLWGEKLIATQFKLFG